MVRVEEEASVEIGESLFQDILKTLAVAPPMLCVVIDGGNGNDADGDIVTESLLEEQPAAAGVEVFGDHVNAADGELVLLQPLAKGESGAVGAVAIVYMGRNHVDQVAGKATFDQETGTDPGRSVEIIDVAT